jgi:hypothetical protein
MTVQAPKLQIEKTPTEKIIEKENAVLETEVIDKDGRVLKLRLPDPLDECDLYAALGKDHSANVGVLVSAMPLIFIESIDGVPFTRPNNYPEVRMAIKRLGRNSMDAVNKAIQKYQKDQEMTAEEITNLKK